jgi:tRNA A-37 threonylcarbamoyl transferase component Bud32
MSSASESKQCPKCGGLIPAEASQGLCPKCLMLQASLPTEAAGGPSAKSAPPTHEALAAAFPQLEILELIGQGGMGFVFKARQLKLDRLVALKILPQSLAADPAFAERFTREGRMLARLNHPNIVTVHDFGLAPNGFFYLLMEYVDGVNLRQAMKAGRFTPAQALAIVPKICEALQFAHNEGILHRDIKPENILLDAKGRVKIADFGIAKLLGERRAEATLTGAGATLGTPNYMAPEQIENSGDVDHRADIYSLGVVFYEMLTGGLPIGHFALPSEKSYADPRLDDVVLRTLEKDRERRTQTAGEVKTQVETIAGSAGVPPLPGQPVPATPGQAFGKPDRFWRRMAVGLLLLVVAMPIAYFSVRSHLAPSRAAVTLPTAPVPLAGAKDESATLVMDTVPFDLRRVNPLFRDNLFWEFKYLVPAGHLAQLLFVLWTNGVPTINAGFSSYCKVGPKPVVLENVLISCGSVVSGPDGVTNVTQWNVCPGWDGTGSEWLSNQPPYRKLETAPRAVLHSGRQVAIRLAEFVRPAGTVNNGWSGVEIRLILQPLQSPPVRTDPNEFDFTNYVAGYGLAGVSEESLINLIKTLPCEPTAAENGLREPMITNVGLAGVSPESAELREAKARLAQLRTQFTETNVLVQQLVARIKELENK